MYNILEAKIKFKNNQVDTVAVLVEISKGDVRAICATTKQLPGYVFIAPNQTVTNDLLQEIAGFGLETDKRDEIFPNWKQNLPKK